MGLRRQDLYVGFSCKFIFSWRGGVDTFWENLLQLWMKWPSPVFGVRSALSPKI
jgi:hypothetical protein